MNDFSNLPITQIPSRNLHVNNPIGKFIYFMPSTTSTNDVAMKLGADGCEEGTVVIADKQSQGRGRSGRLWFSPQGINLYFTVILKPELKVVEAPLITLMAAVATVQAVRQVTEVAASIKWPNDLQVNGKKLGGILAESKTRGDFIHLIALGIGLNVNLDLSILPDELKPRTTSLYHELGKAVPRFRLLDEILHCLEKWYKILLLLKQSYLIQSWKSLNTTLGTHVHVETGNTTVLGKAIDIGHMGELIVKTTEGSIIKVVAADVTHCNHTHAYSEALLSSPSSHLLYFQ